MRLIFWYVLVSVTYISHKGKNLNVLEWRQLRDRNLSVVVRVEYFCLFLGFALRWLSFWGTDFFVSLTYYVECISKFFVIARYTKTDTVGPAFWRFCPFRYPCQNIIFEIWHSLFLCRLRYRGSSFKDLGIGGPAVKT